MVLLEGQIAYRSRTAAHTPGGSRTHGPLFVGQPLLPLSYRSADPSAGIEPATIALEERRASAAPRGEDSHPGIEPGIRGVGDRCSIH